MRRRGRASAARRGRRRDHDTRPRTLRLRQLVLGALAERILAGGRRLLLQREVGRRPRESGRELVDQRQPRRLRLLRLQRPVLINVDDFLLHAERRRVVGRLDQQFLIRLHRAPEITLVAKPRRHAPQHLDLVRRVGARREEAVRRVRATDLRERDRHVVEGLIPQPEPRLPVRRQLVVRIDQPPEHVDRFAGSRPGSAACPGCSTTSRVCRATGSRCRR